MKLPGKYLREKSPLIYSFLVSIYNRFQRLTTPHYMYITDSLGGSFKDYLAMADIQDRINRLSRNLDKDSTDTINIIIQRLREYPDEKNKHRISKRKEIAGGRLPVETFKTAASLKATLKEVNRITRLPSHHLSESVFCFKHGLRLFPGAVTDYIKDSDFIDAGAFIGDSAIALEEYGYRKIYSIEISQKSLEKYRINLKRYGIDPDRYEAINAGISADVNAPPVTFPDTGSAGISVLRSTGKYDLITVERKPIDYFVTKFSITPRFIKADIEGSALDFVKGASGTLTKFRPVLSIAIYHNPFEFFEVKPFLEDLLNDYIFFIRKLSSGIKNNECHSEVILLGCPGEIIDKKQLKPLALPDF